VHPGPHTFGPRHIIGASPSASPALLPELLRPLRRPSAVRACPFLGPPNPPPAACRHGGDPTGPRRRGAAGVLAPAQPRGAVCGGGDGAEARGRSHRLHLPGGGRPLATPHLPLWPLLEWPCRWWWTVRYARHFMPWCPPPFPRFCAASPQNFTCKAPTKDPEKVKQLLSEPRLSAVKPDTTLAA
jgi:hypothetical protein